MLVDPWGMVLVLFDKYVGDATAVVSTRTLVSFDFFLPDCAAAVAWAGTNLCYSWRALTLRRLRLLLSWQVKEIVSDTVIKLDDHVPEDYIGVSCVVFASKC